MPRFALSVVIFLALVATAQGQHLVTDQKTIEISATEKVVVPADTATVKIGYQNLAISKDAAYAESTRAGNKILQAILDAGVSKDAIETESLRAGAGTGAFHAKTRSTSQVCGPSEMASSFEGI